MDRRVHGHYGHRGRHDHDSSLQLVASLAQDSRAHRTEHSTAPKKGWAVGGGDVGREVVGSTSVRWEGCTLASAQDGNDGQAFRLKSSA